MNNVIRFPASKPTPTPAAPANPNDHYLSLDHGYECLVITQAGIDANQHGLLTKDHAIRVMNTKDRLALNIQKPNGTVVASLIVDIDTGIARSAFYKDEVYSDDTAAVARLIHKKQWIKHHSLPDENFIYTIDGHCHSFRSLPDDLHVRGDLVIKGADNVHFPKTLTLTGDLRIESSHISSPPSYLQAHTVRIVTSRLSTVASVVKCERLLVENCAIDQICGIGNIKEDVIISDLLSASRPPSTMRIGRNLFTSSDCLADLSTGSAVMGKISALLDSDHLPWSTDFLGRVLRPGDYVRFLHSVPLKRDGESAFKSAAGFAARFISGDKDSNAIVSLDDAANPNEFITAPSAAILRTDEADFNNRRTTYDALFSDSPCRVLGTNHPAAACRISDPQHPRPSSG